jgi:FMN phosphatase YigB (HAD superfamily)
MPATDHSGEVWTRDETLRPLLDRLAPAAARPAVVSFDCFDTLLFRLCAEPSDLFIETGRQLAARGLLRAAYSPSEYRSVRLAADDKARGARVSAGKLPEVTLTEIYAELGDVVTDPAAARQVEWDIERSLCFVNPAMVSLVEHVRALGLRTAIVSDTYFTAEELLRLLADQGVPASLFDAVLVSCELGKAKSCNGTLYHELLDHFDVCPGEVLHIGDNLHADVHQARRLGIDTLHYPRRSPTLQAALSGEHRLSEQAGPGAGSLETVRVLSARQAEGDQDPFRDGAFVLGPVLSRFADWCVGQYARAGVRRVLALMREGELLGELLARSAAASGVQLEVVTCYASRMATARAALPSVTLQSATTLLEGATQLSPQGILEILGLGAEGAEFMDEDRRLKPLPSSEAAHKFLGAVFALPRIRELIESRQRESHELAFEYLSSLVGGERTVGVLDLGWSGSIQRNIARILRQGGHEVRTVGCYLACTKRAGRLALEGQEAHAYLDAEWDRNAILVEVCTTACVGSTCGYERDAAGRVRPVLEPDPNSPGQRLAKGRLREGVLAFQDLWLALSRRAEERGWSSDLMADIDRFSPSILFRWMDFPTKPEADRLALLHHDENYFGSINSALASDEQTRARLRREGVSALFRDTGCYWPQGVVAQVYPRLMTMLRERWRDPIGMGRLGAYGRAGAGDSGLTGDEVASLGVLLAGFAPDQVVFCGPAGPDVISQVNDTRQSPDTAAAGAVPRLIVAGSARPAPVTGASDPEASCVEVRGGLDEAATLLGIRAAIHPGASVALVLSGDVSAAELAPLLHGLAPFLGPRGAILVACGRYDRHSVQTDNPLGPAIAAWLESAGTDLGYGLRQGRDPRLIELRSNWIIFEHAPEKMLCNRQWMPTGGDLAADARPSSPEPQAAPAASDAAKPVAGARPPGVATVSADA